MTPRTTTNPESPAAPGRMVSRKGVVTHGQALAAILGTLTVAGLAGAWVLNESKEPARAVEKRLDEHIEAHQGEVRDLKQEVRDGRNDDRLFLRLRYPGLPRELTAPLPEFPLDGGR